MFATKEDKIRLPLAVYLCTPRATSGLVRREAKTNYVLPSHNQFVKSSQAFRNHFFFLNFNKYLLVIPESGTNPCFDVKPHPTTTIMCLFENTLASKIFPGSIWSSNTQQTGQQAHLLLSSLCLHSLNQNLSDILRFQYLKASKQTKSLLCHKISDTFEF